MEVNLAAKEVKPHSSSMMLDVSSNSNAMMMKRKEENKIATEISMNDDNNDDGLLLASLPKAEVKLKKLDESKLLMDNNENSLSVDALIDILSSSNETKPILDDIKNELMNIDDENFNMPPTSIPSTLDSPSPSSSSGKTGFSSPTPNANESNTSSYTPSPKSSSTPHKKFPSPHPNGGKPMMADLNKKMKQLSRRQPKPKAVYQSQISDNSVGIKLCIKKSINTFKMLPSPNNSNSNSKSPRKRLRKSNKTTPKVAEGGSDSDDPYVKRRKKSSTSTNNNSSKASFEEPIEQSVWGKDLPKEILLDVSPCNDVIYT